MPKHGWKWRTEKLRRLSQSELEDLLRDPTNRVSARLARWVYETLLPEVGTSGAGIAALRRIAEDQDSPWAESFLWSELEKHKSGTFGDWIVIALAWRADTTAHAMRFVALYEDPTAHPMTRGSAIFGLNNCLTFAGEPSVQLLDVARTTCAKALQDEDNPYARAGACWLASQLGGFEAELAVLANDRTPVGANDSMTVADYCE